MDSMDAMTYYVWRITFPKTGEVLMSSRPYTTENRARASLKQMAWYYAKWHEDDCYYLDILCTADHAPRGEELNDIIQTTTEDAVINLVRPE